VSDRPIPLLGDISLSYVQRIEHALDAGFTATRIAGLDGDVQQRAGRPSHRVRIAGLLVGDSAQDDLGKLQAAAQGGDEMTFAADITSALDLQKVVIGSFHAEEVAGHPGRIAYVVELVESPPLPPPAEVGGFGGLDGFGLGDLGIDAGVLGDIADAAGQVASVVDQAKGAIEAVSAIASIASSGGLNFGGVLEPIDRSVKGVKDIAGGFQSAARALGGVFGS
jgi:hypothetical protein